MAIIYTDIYSYSYRIELNCKIDNHINNPPCILCIFCLANLEMAAGQPTIAIASYTETHQPN